MTWTKIFKNFEKSIDFLFKNAIIKTVKRDKQLKEREEKIMVNYIHEQELASMALEMWNKIYNHTPFTPYDEKYLKTLYNDLFKFDRENRWILMHASVNYDIWMQAYDEHSLISKLIAKIFAYIEPFDYIENLIKPYTSEEETCYKEKWGMLI